MWHQIIIVGNLGRDPEMRYTPGGQAVTDFSVASNREYTNNAGEKIKETIWFKVAAWGKTAENVVQYLHKGSKVLVEGRLTADKSGNPKIWKGSDGEAHASFEVTANNIRFLSSKGEGGGEGAGDPIEPTAPPADPEDIPF